MNITLMNPYNIHPTEEIDLENKKKLLEKIQHAEVWTVPIIIHEEHHFVMDGHHRLSVAKLLGLHSIPVVKRNYSNVTIASWRNDWHISESLILEKFQKGERFPYKTTKHIFKYPIPNCSYSLTELGHPLPEKIIS